MSRRTWYQTPRPKRVRLLLDFAKGTLEEGDPELLLDLIYDIEHETKESRGIILPVIWTELLQQLKRLRELRDKRGLK